MTPLLAIDDLHLELTLPGGALPVLRGVSLSLAPGRVLGVVGESGAGKTMVGKAVLGIAPGRARISGGSIVFDGDDITHLAGDERRALLGRGMALIPQDPMSALNPVRRIDAQMTDMLRLHLGLDRAAAATRAKELLEAVHIRHPSRVLRQYPHELSGGMRQRVLIAIAFACRPRLIVADEPTTALDVTVQRQILRLIKELQSNFGTALLFISHDLGVVAKICDEVAVMYAGRVLEWAPAADIFARPTHDYTRALFAATPRYDRPAEALKPVPSALTERLLAEAAAYDARRAGSLGHA
jgi:peptide/nickel transport system ATP-binding protein